MPRKPRELVQDGVYHVYARGTHGCRIFCDDADHLRYLHLLERVVRRRSWSLWSYCLMPTHVHLLLSTPSPDLHAGMGFLHGQYAVVFNKRHGRAGHLFGSRYGAKRVTTDPQLWVTAAYVANNPVAAGLCRTPEAWPWSSHRATVEDAAPTWVDDSTLMEHFAAAGGDPRETYRSFVAREEPRAA